MTAPTDIANLAVSLISQAATAVHNIDIPKTDIELSISKWYDQSRKEAIIEFMPNFARKRRLVPKVSQPPDFFGYAFSYEKPADCLWVLGVGEKSDDFQEYDVEGGTINTDVDYENGLPLRFLADITNADEYDPMFTKGLALKLAMNTVGEIKRDEAVRQAITGWLNMEIAKVNAFMMQENKAIRVTSSGWKQASTYGNVYRLRKP